MNRLLICWLLPALLLVSCGGGGERLPLGESVLIPAALQDGSVVPEIFSAALPDEDSFNPQRVPAVSSLSQNGIELHEGSPNVTANGLDAEFAPAGTLEYGLWRFAGTPDDSVGNVSVVLDDISPGASYWVAVADYSTGRWDWIGHVDDGTDFQFPLNGSAGQHSSPAGYIYLAVLADTDIAFSVHELTIEYLQRYDVSGVVLDLQDQPLGQALITTNLLDVQPVQAGPGGTFTLNGIPNGSWTVMVALDGYSFIPAMLSINVANANVEGLEFRGAPQLGGWVGDDQYEPNDNWFNSYAASVAPTDASISVLDDPDDYYRFPVPAEGWYYLQIDADDTILFPSLRLLNDHNRYTNQSSQVLRGSNWVGYYFPRQGNYYVQVSCEGGGGHYDLSLHSGRTARFNAYLGDDGGPGDGDDGLYEELYVSSIEMSFSGFTSWISSFGTGTVRHDYMPPLSCTIRPDVPGYTFDPESVEHDFGTGDLLGLDFNLSATAPVDTMEPNDDKTSATQLSLPLAEPVQGWIGGLELTGEDSYDWFRIEAQGDKSLLVRVRFPDNAPQDFGSAGYLDVYDASDSNVSMDNYYGSQLELRSDGVLSAGTHYIRVFMEGPLMPYELEVLEYDARFLSANYFLDGEPMQYAMLSWIFPDGSYSGSEQCTDGLVEYDLPFHDGETILVHHERFGMQFNPDYEWVTFDGADVALTPLAMPQVDVDEVNDEDSQAFPLSLPADITASYSTQTDFNDWYRFNGLVNESLEFMLEPTDKDCEFIISINRIGDNTRLLELSRTGDMQFYFRVDTPGDYSMRVYASPGGETEYRLRVKQASETVYRISGTVDSGVANEQNYGSPVVNHTSGYFIRPNPFTYNLGYYPNGDYELEWQAVNRTVTPAGKFTVTLAGADLVQDFTSVYLGNDALEPNDTGGTAAAISLPADFNATLDYDDNTIGAGADFSDYYSFTAGADGVVEISVTPKAGWVNEFRLSLAEDASFNEVSLGKLNPVNGLQMLRYPVTSGHDYLIRINNSYDLPYRLEATYLP
ncbi:MAG: carboxypeptidase-like regulatory domain-containing protein [bacterium]